MQQLYGEIKMIVKTIEEHEDGSATVVLENIEPEMMRLLIEKGFITLLKEYLDKEEKERKIPALLKEKVE